jgi:hypothetical protein
MPIYTPNITEKFIYGDFINVMNLRAFQTLNIYVNSTTGQDSGTGRGSQSAPYKSMKFALKDAFSLLNNAQVVINLAGAALHTLPDGFVFPELLSQDQVTLEADPLFGFNKRAPLVVRATPTLVRAFTAPEIVSQSNNAISGLKRLTTGGGLTPGDLNGKWAQDANGVLARISVNDATNIDLAYAGSNIVAPINVYDSGATIAPLVPGSPNPTVVLRAGGAPIIFFGVAILGSTGGAVQVGPGQQASFVCCDIPSLEVGRGVNSLLSLTGAVECIACDLSSLSLPAANLFVNRSRFSEGTFTNMSRGSKVVVTQSYFGSMDSPCFSDGESSPNEIQMTNCAVLDSTTDGVQVINGLLNMTECDVAGAADDGVFGLRQATLKLTGVGSSVDNGNNGIYLQNGSVCEVDATTSLEGAVNAILLGVNGVAYSTFAVFRTGSPPYSAMAEGENSSIWQDAQGGSPSTIPLPVLVTTTPYNQKSSDTYILVDATIEPIQINLLPVASFAGKTLVVKKIDASANTVTIQCDGAETIDGENTRPLLIQYQGVTILSGPSEWSVI